MYSNKLAVAIKANGKALREFEDQVYLPFQTEYSIFIKNKNSVRASVKIEIDGVDAPQGVSLVVDPNDEIELERFIKNGNLDRGNRFKFIERTSSVERNRGVKVDDGLVRVEFQFEKVIQTITSTPNWHHQPYQPPNFPPLWNSAGSTGDPSLLMARGFCSSTSTSTSAVGGAVSNCTVAGITAPGSVSNQGFNSVSNFALEPQKHVMILRLLGEHLGKSVSNAVTTRSKTQCDTCGYLSKTTSAKFCSNCGASLQIIY
jgi:hypothetical protein